MRTNESQRPTLGLVMGGGEGNGPASSNFGPVRVGLTTTHRTRSQVPLELLSSWESSQEILESKYLEVLDTLTSVTEILVRLTASLLPTSITEEEKNV